MHALKRVPLHSRVIDTVCTTVRKYLRAHFSYTHAPRLITTYIRQCGRSSTWTHRVCTCAHTLQCEYPYARRQYGRLPRTCARENELITRQSACHVLALTKDTQQVYASNQAPLHARTVDGYHRLKFLRMYYTFAERRCRICPPDFTHPYAHVPRVTAHICYY